MIGWEKDVDVSLVENLEAPEFGELIRKYLLELGEQGYLAFQTTDPIWPGSPAVVARFSGDVVGFANFDVVDDTRVWNRGDLGEAVVSVGEHREEACRRGEGGGVAAWFEAC